ncbi:hypothetical protein X884_5805 [Burkholderia pseudomallei MSHR4308]|nr:hypothetical protein X883_3557 [Burkholderia pseudomallei MSHR4304]KGV42871.1 hypothetical protein X884_5805 [Burkholderia pseudomallei MSHR4308]
MAGYCSTARAVRAGRRSPAVLRASRAVAPRRFVRRRPSDMGRPPPAGRNRPCKTDRGQPDADSRPGPCRRLATEHRRPVAHRPSRNRPCVPGVIRGPPPAVGGAHFIASRPRIGRQPHASTAPAADRLPPPFRPVIATHLPRQIPAIDRPASVAAPRSSATARARAASSASSRRPHSRPSRTPRASRLAPTPTEADFRAAHAHRTHGCAGRARTAPRPRARSRRQARTRTRTSRCARR